MNHLDLHRIPALHTEDGGHEFHNGHVFPMDQREAWHEVEEPPAPRWRFPAVNRPVLVGALLALPGVVMFAVEGLRLLMER